MTDSFSKPAIHKLFLAAVLGVILNCIGLIAWIIVMILGMLMTTIVCGFANKSLPFFANATVFNVIVYGVLPLYAYPAAFYSVWFLARRKVAFREYKATFCTIGSIVVWLGYAALVWSAPPHPRATCIFSAGPELFFPFPFFEVLVINTCGQCWAAYRICKDQKSLSL